jgi:hypothetical protein
MKRRTRVQPIRIGLVLLATASLAFGIAFGSAMASGSRTASLLPLPCTTGGSGCMKIGFTRAWYNGHSVKLEYSHRFFCAEPPSSGASSHCEAGRAANKKPSSGAIVSNIYELIPLGFTPSASTLQCPARCIDHPRTMDLSRVFGGMGADASLPARSLVIEDKESFQSTWWPVVLVGVKNLHAWNTIAAAKTITAVDHCQASGGCVHEKETNAFVFFQVLGPGMSPAGPS